MNSLTLILLVIIFSLMRINIGISIILSCLIYLLTSDLPLLVMAQKVSSGVNSYLYIAVPLYILAGTIMEEGGITDKIIDAAKLLVGHITGGLAQVNVLYSVIFAAVSGSALADVASEGPVLIPAMKKMGFDASFAAALTAASSLIGPVIPPSICFVVYGSIASVSIGRMFLAGVIPGLIMGGYMACYCYYVAKKRHYPRSPRASFKVRAIGLFESLPAISMPLIVLGGIGLGFFTPTESAAVAVLYGLVYSILNGTFSLNSLAKQLYKAGIVTIAVLLVVAGASLLGYILTVEGTPKRLVTALMGYSENPYLVMLILGGFLMLVGMFMSVNAAIVILAPILLPIARAFNFDLVWFGVLICLWLNIGLLTPPVCSCLQLSCAIAKVRLVDGFKEVFPFILLMVVMCSLMTFFPSSIMFLPNMLMQ